MASTVDYGTDFSTYPDLNFGRQIDGERAIVEAAARAMEDSPSGLDLRQWLNRELGPGTINDLEQVILSRVLADERVADAKVTIAHGPAQTTGVVLSIVEELRITVEITPADGEVPFQFVLSVTSLGVEILKGAAP
jgi:hypothetical protein